MRAMTVKTLHRNKRLNARWHSTWGAQMTLIPCTTAFACNFETRVLLGHFARTENHASGVFSHFEGCWTEKTTFPQHWQKRVILLEQLFQNWNSIDILYAWEVDTGDCKRKPGARKPLHAGCWLRLDTKLKHDGANLNWSRFLATQELVSSSSLLLLLLLLLLSSSSSSSWLVVEHTTCISLGLLSCFDDNHRAISNGNRTCLCLSQGASLIICLDLLGFFCPFVWTLKFSTWLFRFLQFVATYTLGSTNL